MNTFEYHQESDSHISNKVVEVLEFLEGNSFCDIRYILKGALEALEGCIIRIPEPKPKKVVPSQNTQNSDCK